MVIIQIDDTNHLDRDGITCYKADATVTITQPAETLDFCFCDFECEDYLLAFAGDTEREKDDFLLYYKSKDENLEVVYKINDIELVDVTHGEAITNGFRVDFTKIFNTLGGGDYTLKMEITEFGSEFTKSYGKFRVCPFDTFRADGTVKIEAYQNGNIESGFDYENDNVKFSLRIYGILTNKTKVNLYKDTPTNSRESIQVHNRWWYEYDLIFDSNKYNFVKLILDNMLVGSKLFISDYNLANMTKDEPFNKIQLIEKETNSEHVKNTNTTRYTVKLEDAIKNNVKHPYIQR